MSYKIFKIQKTKKTYVQKIQNRMIEIAEFENFLRRFVRKHDDRIYDWASQFTLEKIPRMKMIVDESLQLEMFDRFKRLGFGITVSLAKKLSDVIKATLSRWKKKQSAELPREINPDKLNCYSIRLGPDNYKILSDKRKIVIFLGRKRDKETPKLAFKLPQWLNPSSIKTDGIILKWIRDAYVELQVIYDSESVETPKLDENNWISIDFGQRNFAAIVSNVLPSLLINGKPIRNMFRSLHKHASEFQSKNDIRQLRLLHRYRKNLLDVIYHTIVNELINLCISARVSKIYYGKNVFSIFHEKSKLSKKFNKYFRFFSFGRFIQILKYKAEQVGIEVISVDEAYTSQTDPITQSGDDFINRKTDMIICKSGIYHADLAAALNIAAKHIDISTVRNLKAKLTRPFKILKCAKASDTYTLVKQLKRYSESCLSLIAQATRSI